MIRPDLRQEKSLLRQGHGVVAGCDEVGRGALSGPVTVAVVTVDHVTGRVPIGLADSKLLSAQRRESLVPKVTRWSHAHAIGSAGPAEIDAFGIIVALRLAALRALAGLPVAPDVVLLDGSHDWLSATSHQPELFVDDPPWPAVPVPTVITRVKADLHCASVAAASVLAKTHRDAHMRSLADRYPAFDWQNNKGYASAHHLASLDELGPCDQHRQSWRLPGRQRMSEPGRRLR